MRFRLILIFALAVLAFACTDPAANKPKASVSNSAPETNPTKPAGAETLTISPDNSKIDFVAAKVTRSHNGSFKRFRRRSNP
jgi:polyisoprenoid-binding protein YceI